MRAEDLRNEEDHAAARQIIPFHTFLLKTASRCNIDCKYCYVYHQADDGWRSQPKLMSRDTAKLAMERIEAHLRAHGKSDCSIVFHGGEPLLGGQKHLQMLVETVLEGLVDQGFEVTLGIQSNGLLFDTGIGNLCRKHGVSLGVSLDGPAHVNDQNRIDHQGRPTTTRLEPKLRMLRDEYPDVFAGFLCVIDPASDPLEVYDYLLSYEPRSIDFLFPLNNHDRLPPALRATGLPSYGSWLTSIYDQWLDTPGEISIRLFRSIMNMWLGKPSLVESIGLLPVDLVVIETNGEIEAVDSLKATYAGATKLGFSLAQNTFDEVARDVGVVIRQSGVLQLCDTCRACPIVDVCGGGYIPHRYSRASGFSNPSIYCRDLTYLITHIGASIRNALGPAIPINVNAENPYPQCQIPDPESSLSAC